MTTSEPSSSSILDTTPLRERSAVITGASRGIGAETARQLAAAGAAVVLAARSSGDIQALAEELTAAGHRAWAVETDVTDPDSVQQLAQRAVEHTGGAIDILVNNAGIAASAPVQHTDLGTWDRIFAVNVTGVFLCTKALLPGMVEKGWGRVINIASVAGKMGAPYISAYAASKHAVVGFTRCVALEVARKGVTVNAVCPGYVDTDMAAQAIDNITGKTQLDADQARASLEAMSPQARIFTADEVAYQVLSLCHPRAGGINAQSIVLDGGTVQT